MQGLAVPFGAFTRVWKSMEPSELTEATWLALSLERTHHQQPLSL